MSYSLVMATTRITKAQATAALNAVRRAFKSYLKPFEGHSPLCPEPTLNMDWNGNVVILWEEGPSDWAQTATWGGVSDEDRSLYADASVEFGVNLKPKGRDPISWPNGVYAEPYNSFVLCLYPA